MYQSHVISGRILEIQDNRIVTQQGDLISTYHSRYYMYPEEGLEPEPETGHAEDEASSYAAGRPADTPNEREERRRPMIPFKPWLIFTGKSANRI